METLFIFNYGKDENGWLKSRGSFVKIPYRSSYLSCELKFDLDKGTDEDLYLYQGPIVLAASCSRMDVIERKLRAEAPFVNNGDEVKIIVIDGNEIKVTKELIRKVKVLGDYSDAAILEKVGE